ncbi:aspartate carbamoyltransferase [Alicyclobacillus sendaiensis]|uniref:Aspartate carbamoyltransferase n=1 Tax=Alicyclobacillus sendaiensis PA2 TaxID=3029425 RepID=A0ABT6XY25_ALISE|nr:aspartate carbamoyltransferase [Alicyclobacillus sendaiensis]MDI9259986.1 aspartate carbamoyltransferase [Alicyclobacillus sendaiensis PA2]
MRSAVFHALTVNQFDVPLVWELMERAEWLRGLDRDEARTRLRGKIVATLFYEPSTRTRLSFESAVLRLGGSVVGAENARESSSSKKGETLEDVFRVVGCYADAIVIRHHDQHELDRAARFSPVPIVNAGAGTGEHPTQALLDVYTIWRELGRIEQLTVAVMGDLKYGRTVHSLLRLLVKFPGVRVRLFHPAPLGLPDDLVGELASSGLAMEEAPDLASAIRGADVVYQTRIQFERLAGEVDPNAASLYALTKEHLALLPDHARILHPLPRVGEIAPEVDDDARAAYFRQVENGLYMRMALLDAMLGGEWR